MVFPVVAAYKVGTGLIDSGMLMHQYYVIGPSNIERGCFFFLKQSVLLCSPQQSFCCGLQRAGHGAPCLAQAVLSIEIPSKNNTLW